jgi:predicted amino acid-binding ACT domain protein
VALPAEVRALLKATSLPPDVADDLIEGASPLWLMSDPPDVIASDLVLCHPPLALGEVRAGAKATSDPTLWRLTVVTQDRPGLMALTAGVLAERRLKIQAVAANAWPKLGTAVQRLSVAGDPDWDEFGSALRAAYEGGTPPQPDFAPLPPVRVTATAEEGDRSQGRSLLRVQAPDRVGLLWAVAHWLTDNGTNIEMARLGNRRGLADGTFLVGGPVDAAALARYLSGAEPRTEGVGPAATALVGAGSRLANRIGATAAGWVQDRLSDAASLLRRRPS